MGSATNNQVEYNVVICLLTEVSHCHIPDVRVLLDSQLVILQLNNVYHIPDPYLFPK
jgi:ribonuclease HI